VGWGSVWRYVMDFATLLNWEFLDFYVCFWILRRFVAFVEDGVAANFGFECGLERGYVFCRCSSVELVVRGS
jgi:hypothetical protein